MALNNVVLIGNLTADVNLRYTQNDKAVGNFILAVQRSFKDQNGDYQADFIRCQIWGKSAESLAQYQKKGSKIGVIGEIQTGKYTNDKGDTVYTTDVNVRQVDFLSPPKNQGQDNGQNSYQQQSQADTPNPYQQNQEKAQNQQSGNYQQNNQQNNPFGQNEPLNISGDDLPF